MSKFIFVDPDLIHSVFIKSHNNTSYVHMENGKAFFKFR